MKKTNGFAGGMIMASCEDHVGSLLIDNPRRKNAVTQAMWRALPQAIRWLEADAQARVLVLEGAGDADFCAGADISEFDTVRGDRDSAALYEAENSAAFAAIREAGIPSIAAIRGICYGGGFGLAAACDLRVADRSARFCIPPTRLGLAYPADAVGDIVEALGSQMARLAIYTGEVMQPEALAANGFLLDCVQPEELDLRVTTIARTIAANAPLSVRASKLAIRAVVAGNPMALANAAALGAATFDSNDYAEGRLAFAERRKPHFTGN